MKQQPLVSILINNYNRYQVFNMNNINNKKQIMINKYHNII